MPVFGSDYKKIVAHLPHYKRIIESLKTHGVPVCVLIYDQMFYQPIRIQSHEYIGNKKNNRNLACSR